MTIKEIVNELSLEIIAGNELLDREITGGYCCDLLSWVMANGKKGGLWITVQTHINIVAVATLLELGCIIVPENIEVDGKTVEKAKEENVVILSSNLDAFTLAGLLYKLGIGV